jgi:hypothetical protein
VAQLPFGSFTPNQCVDEINFTESLSNLADLSKPLQIQSHDGFYLGKDEFLNPSTDQSTT